MTYLNRAARRRRNALARLHCRNEGHDTHLDTQDHAKAWCRRCGTSWLRPRCFANVNARSPWYAYAGYPTYGPSTSKDARQHEAAHVVKVWNSGSVSSATGETTRTCDTCPWSEPCRVATTMLEAAQPDEPAPAPAFPPGGGSIPWAWQHQAKPRPQRGKP